MSEAPSKKMRSATAIEARQSREGLFRFSMVQLLGSLVVLLIVYPFIIELEHGELIEAALMMVILILAVLAVGVRRWVLTIVLVLPALAGPWMDHYLHGLVPFWIISCARMVFVGFVVFQLLRFILRSPRVNSEVLCAGISAYLLLGICWTAAYLAVSESSHGAYSGAHLAADQHLGHFDAIYLSFTSLTCVGCGDILPVSKVAKMLMMMESITGVLFLAVLIARLVALYTQAVAVEPDQHRRR